MPQCTAKAKSTQKRCTRDAVKGYNVCYVHGANPKNHGGGEIKHGLYVRNPGEKLKRALDASVDIRGLEPELLLLRSRLALFMEAAEGREEEGRPDVTLNPEVLESLSRIIGRIESLVKTISQLKLLSDVGVPEHVTIVVDALGIVIREYVPQAKWREAIDKLGKLVDVAGEPKRERSSDD